MLKYVYVLVSNEDDIYYENTLVSVTSLRMHIPNAWVALVVDDQTANSLVGKRSQIKNLIDELKIIPLDNTLSGTYRSRELKTSVRNLVDGDFLYIDGDTVITHPLPSLHTMDCEIGAVLDYHIQVSEHPRNSSFYRNAELLKFSPYQNNKYFNGGVLYVKDTSMTRSFFSRWNELWHYCTTKEIFIDQPSLAQVDYEFGYVIQELPGEWNCQAENCINYLKNAHIMHFFSSNEGLRPHPLMNLDIFHEVKATGIISEKTMNIIKNVQTSFFPHAKIYFYIPFYDTNTFYFFYSLYKRQVLFQCFEWCIKWFYKFCRILKKRLSK
ncbi:MAG: hypothetical protein LBC85_01625 [Fibromonadaceae bacterium]|jgi:hypothetical protein|nr:hypothetical protein [Fibromonadaceae bacterium]